jgi:hypothetical protein
MTIGYIERVMDNLAKRRDVDVVAAFLEQDNYFANHLHFAWRSPLDLTRDIRLAKSMRTKESVFIKRYSCLLMVRKQH